jgi:choline dehydrogenase-like flavoprotein
VHEGGWPAEILDADAKADLTHDWGFQGVSATRAKILGGCSSHNECVVAWAAPGDHERWVRLGDDRWGFDEQRPLLDRAQTLLRCGTPSLRPIGVDVWIQIVATPVRQRRLAVIGHTHAVDS